MRRWRDNMTAPERLIRLQDMALEGKYDETLPAEEQQIVTDIEHRINGYMDGLKKLMANAK